jgi:hypothetical protein
MPKGVCRHCKKEGHYYRYPKDQVPPHTNSKSRQGAGRASMRCHVICSFGPHLPAEVCYGATMCPAAPDLTYLLRWAPVLPCVPQLQTLPPWRGELWCCHVSHGFGFCLPERGAPVLSRVPWLGALPSWEGSSGTATCSIATDGLWTTWIKKCLAALGTQLDSRVSKARSCVAVVPARRAGRYSVAL